MRKKIVIIFLFFLSQAFAQDFSKIEKFIESNPTKSFEIDSLLKPIKRDAVVLKKLYLKSIGGKLPVNEAYLANYLGVCFRDYSSYKLALNYHNHALKLSKKIKVPLIEINSYNMIGVVYRRMDSIKPAIDNHQQALVLIDKIKKIDNDVLRNKAIALNSLGNVYLVLNQFELAMNQFKQCLKIETKLKNNLGRAINYQNIGEALENLNQLDLALANYKMSRDVNPTDLGILICNNSIGSVLLKQNKFKEAYNYILPTLKIANEIKDDYYTSLAITNLGWVYYEMNDFEKAKKNLYEALKISEEKNFLSSMEIAYKILHEIYDKEKNYKLSNEFLKKYYLVNNKLSGEKNQKYMFDFISNYEIEKRENILKIKDNELKINRLELDSKEKQKWLFGSIILLLIIISSLILKQNMNRKATNLKLTSLIEELDTANKTKARFFSILNHDLRSPVSNLIHFLHLKKNNPELLDEESKARLEEKTISGAENLLRSMEDLLLWSKSQMENFKPHFINVSVSQIFQDTKKHFESNTHITFEFILDQEITLITDENYLKTIVRNIISNAIKALNDVANAKVVCKSWIENDLIYLSIHDNGKGTELAKFKALYDDKEVVGIKTGLGLHLIRDLAKSIHCKIDVISKINDGTRFLLTLPNKV